jgi:excisionase family DNA binding protein
MGAHMADELLSPAQAADIAACHNDTIRRAIEKGFLAGQRVGRNWVIKRSDLEKWIEAGRPNHRRKTTRKQEESEETDQDGTGDSQ